MSQLHRQKLQKLQNKLEEWQDPLKNEDEKEAQEGRRLPKEEEQLQALVERRIQQAISEGKFDNLPGQGKPLNLRENPYTEPGQEWAFGLLKRNGFAPEWIERDKTIRQRLAQAREKLAQAWQRHKDDPTAWQHAVAQFDTELQKLNRQIDDLNLIVPTMSCQRRRLSLKAELGRLTG